MTTNTLDPRLEHVLDTERLLILRSLDEDKGAFLDELIELYRATTPAVLERIFEAIQTQDVDDTVLLAHKLKGMSSNIGISSFVAMLERIEVEFAEMESSERESLKTKLSQAYETAVNALFKDWYLGDPARKAV